MTNGVTPTAGTPPASQSCGNCKFLINRTVNSVAVKECHYNPPDSTKNPNNWPAVLDTDWCGQWLAFT